jgi:hypothetical protein
MMPTPIEEDAAILTIPPFGGGSFFMGNGSNSDERDNKEETVEDKE